MLSEKHLEHAFPRHVFLPVALSHRKLVKIGKERRLRHVIPHTHHPPKTVCLASTTGPIRLKSKWKEGCAIVADGYEPVKRAFERIEREKWIMTIYRNEHRVSPNSAHYPCSIIHAHNARTLSCAFSLLHPFSMLLSLSPVQI
jgi:hypothetical protein